MKAHQGLSLQNVHLPLEVLSIQMLLAPAQDWIRTGPTKDIGPSVARGCLYVALN